MTPPKCSKSPVRSSKSPVHCSKSPVRWFLDYLFSRFAWYRRRAGGHWERWVIDWPVCSILWLRMNTCSRPGGDRPPLGRGAPTCEGE